MARTKPLVNRSAQEIVAGFPTHIALAGSDLGIAGFIYVRPGSVGYWPMSPSLKSLADGRPSPARLAF